MSTKKRRELPRGSSKGVQALIIIHLSSLDAYTDYAGSEEGESLSWRISQAIVGHAGPVIIVDQGWELGPRPSRPREFLLEDISGRRDIVWIKFDEDTDDWDVFFPKLYAALDVVGATSAIMGGIWYHPLLKTGCVSHAYRVLKRRMPVVVDPALVGCE